MSGKFKLSLISLILVAAALAGMVAWCWNIRLTPDTRRQARKDTAKELRAAQGDGVYEFLDKLARERFFHTWFDNKLPYMHVAWETRVPADYIAQLTEEALLRFAGNGQPGTEDKPRLTKLIAFAEAFLPNCATEASANALRDRILDGHFLIDDFDGAIAMLEKGMPGHDPAWCKSTVAKLRAHRAMERAAQPGLDAESVKKAKREAMENFTAFGEYMLSDSMKDFEDCDPTTGVIYSFEWVAAKNFMRSSQLAKEIGDAAKAAELLERAKKYFIPAEKKAKDDKKSLEALKAEMKSYGL